LDRSVSIEGEVKTPCKYENTRTTGAHRIRISAGRRAESKPRQGFYMTEAYDRNCDIDLVKIADKLCHRPWPGVIMNSRCMQNLRSKLAAGNLVSMQDNTMEENRLRDTAAVSP
jgi:hypothetical protein